VPTEIELKLQLTPDAVTFLEASPLLEGPAAKADQRAIYFDTADHALRRDGISLRIRRVGRKRVQTVKASNAAGAGLFDRDEWEFPVKNDTPILDDATPVAALLGDKISAIAPAFDVRIQRQTWMIAQGNARIELVIDRGVAKIGERETAICEAELELKSGEPQALFDLAHRIDAIVPVRLGLLSKSERGYRLLEPASRSYKAEPVAISPGMTAQQAFQSIAHNCLRHYRLNEGLLLASREAEALHQARVAIRRLRSAFTLFKEIHSASQATHFRTELKWLASTLGEARDLDVLAKSDFADSLRKRIEAARSRAYEEVEAVLAGERVRTLFLDLAEWLALGDWLTHSANGAMGVEDFATRALSRLRRRVAKRGRHIDRLEDKPRHEVRKDAKKLRYTAEFMAALFTHDKQRRRQHKFLSALETLQDRLGALNDLATMPDLLDTLGVSQRADAPALPRQDKKPKLLVKAARAHDDFITAKKFWT